MNVKLLKFGAEWCGPCGVMDKRLENFDKCELIKYSVDDDENEELVDKSMDELNKKIDEFIS